MNHATRLRVIAEPLRSAAFRPLLSADKKAKKIAKYVAIDWEVCYNNAVNFFTRKE